MAKGGSHLRPARKFFVSFVGLAIVFYLLNIKLPGSWAKNLTCYLVSLFSQAVGISSSWQKGFVTVSGFKLHINLECTAIHFLSIYIAGVLAYPAHTLRYKLKGIVLGTLSIIFINVLRIVVLGITGANFSSVFDFIHNYLWQGTFVIVVFLTWLIWVERPFFTMPRLRFSGIFLISSAISVFAIGLIIEPYLRFLSEVSDKLFLLTQTDLSISDRLMLI